VLLRVVFLPPLPQDTDSRFTVGNVIREAVHESGFPAARAIGTDLYPGEHNMQPDT
jgi:hypothetical protein